MFGIIWGGQTKGYKSNFTTVGQQNRIVNAVNIIFHLHINICCFAVRWESSWNDLPYPIYRRIPQTAFISCDTVKILNVAKIIGLFNSAKTEDLYNQVTCELIAH